jgi:hypothetical protein
MKILANIAVEMTYVIHIRSPLDDQVTADSRYIQRNRLDSEMMPELPAEVTVGE